MQAAAQQRPQAHPLLALLESGAISPAFAAARLLSPRAAVAAESLEKSKNKNSESEAPPPAGGADSEKWEEAAAVLAHKGGRTEAGGRKGGVGVVVEETIEVLNLLALLVHKYKY